MKGRDAQGPQSLPAPEPGRVTTLCLPCVSAWQDGQGGTVYIAEIRYQGSMPAPSSSRGPAERPRHQLRARAFDDLAAEVRRLPALLQSFEISVGGKRYADAELAAQAVEAELPLCNKSAQDGSAWARLTGLVPNKPR